MINLPTITLDTTLSDLYRLSAPLNFAHPRVAFIPCGWTSGIDLGATLPRNRKFIFQDPATISAYEHGPSPFQTPEKLRDLQIKFLSLVAQRDAFGCGDANVVLFTFDDGDSCEENRGRGDLPNSMTEARKTLNVLNRSQRPTLLDCPNPSELQSRLSKANIDLTIPKLLIDAVEPLDLTVPAETLYYLHSKAALVHSHLPQPHSEILELESFDFATCKTQGQGQEAHLNAWRHRQIDRVLDRIKAHPIPFVLKTNNPGGGGGTFLITTLALKERLLHSLSTWLLPSLLRAVTQENQHLRPADLILQEYIPTDSIQRNYSLTFFVTQTGDAIFLNAPQQLLAENVHWLGNEVDFRETETLRERLSPIMEEIAVWASGFGYYGPVGADVLELPSHPSSITNSITKLDTQPRLLIVDLNVRTPGSMTISLMRNHLSVQRGLHVACSTWVNVNVDRDVFVELFREEFESAKLTVVSWFWDKRRGMAYATLVVAGRERGEMEGLCERVRAVTGSFEF